MKTIYYAVKAPQYAYSFPQPLDTIAFFDIETTGLSAQASSLYLIGMLRYDSAKGEWVLCQWFADDYHSEKALIESFLTELEGITYLYHFNGRTFDIPYLFKKCARHAISLSEHCRKLLNDTSGIYSLDLLAKIRPLRSALSLKQCNQTAIERWLGIYRTDTFSGGELISVYSEYMQQRLLNAKKDTTRTGSLHSAAIPAASSTPKKAEALEKVLLLHNLPPYRSSYPLTRLH
jgi:hypothetical protein